MKRRIQWLLLTTVLAASALLADPQKDAGKPVLRETPPVVQRLALSREQQIQFHSINKERKMQMNAVRSDPTLSPRLRRQRVKEINGASESKIRAMLNQNQQDEYDQIKRERRADAVRKREVKAQPEL